MSGDGDDCEEKIVVDLSQLKQGDEQAMTNRQSFKEMSAAELNATQVTKSDMGIQKMLVGQQSLKGFFHTKPKEKGDQHSVFFNKDTGTKVIHSKNEVLQTEKDKAIVKKENDDVSESTSKTFKFHSDGSLKKTKFKCKPCGKFFLHHKSHLNDPTLQPRKLDASENLFEIIMPWLPDQKLELEQDQKELLNLGIIDQKEYKKRIKTIGGGLSANIDSVKNILKQSKLNVGGGKSPNLSQQSVQIQN